MAINKTEIEVTLKDSDTLDLLLEVAVLQAELIDLIPEWMIESNEISEKLRDKWKEVISKAIK